MFNCIFKLLCISVCVFIGFLKINIMLIEKKNLMINNESIEMIRKHFLTNMCQNLQTFNLAIFDKYHGI